MSASKEYMQMNSSDEKLVKLAVNGDGGAFLALLERHYDLLFRVGYRVLGNREDAEDLAQDICAALPGKLDSFRGGARVTTWLHRLALNAARDRIRRNQAARRKAEGWGDVEKLRRAEALAAQAEQDWLSAAMTALPQHLRETVALVLGEDMTHKQAAEILELSEGTISWRMSEVKNILRDIARKEEMLG